MGKETIKKSLISSALLWRSTVFSIACAKCYKEEVGEAALLVNTFLDFIMRTFFFA